MAATAAGLSWPAGKTLVHTESTDITLPLPVHRLLAVHRLVLTSLILRVQLSRLALLHGESGLAFFLELTSGFQDGMAPVKIQPAD